MRFDAETIREELSAMEDQIKDRPRDSQLVNRYVILARKLRQAEFEKSGYVTTRSSITGY